jgi:hypothetical protein
MEQGDPCGRPRPASTSVIPISNATSGSISDLKTGLSTDYVTDLSVFQDGVLVARSNHMRVITPLNYDGIGFHQSSIVPACGRDAQGQLPSQPNRVLARQLGREIVNLPGGHLGFVSNLPGLQRNSLPRLVLQCHLACEVACGAGWLISEMS